MKLRALASATALSVAVAGGVVPAPTATADSNPYVDSNVALSYIFEICGGVAEAGYKQIYPTDELIAANWDTIKANANSQGSTAPGDFTTLCFEQALVDDDPAVAASAWSLLIFLTFLGIGGLYSILPK